MIPVPRAASRMTPLPGAASRMIPDPGAISRMTPLPGASLPPARQSSRFYLPTAVVRTPEDQS